MNLSKVFLGLAGCLLAASLNGCVVVADDSGSGLGSITVDLTIKETDDPTVCDDSDVQVDEIEFTLVDDLGHTVKQKTLPCGTFSLTFDGVPEGTYDVEMVLLAGPN